MRAARGGSTHDPVLALSVRKIGSWTDWLLSGSGGESVGAEGNSACWLAGM